MTELLKYGMKSNQVSFLAINFIKIFSLCTFNVSLNMISIIEYGLYYNKLELSISEIIFEEEI